MARAEALIQMSIHGDKTRGTGRKEMRRHKKVVFSGRRKEICPLCDRVQKYLSTHLRRYHQLDNESEQYKTAMRIARPYEGVHSEIQWDFHLNATTKKTRPTRGAESDESDLEASKPKDDDIEQLLEQLPSSDSDEEYRPPHEQDSEGVIPPSPEIIPLTRTVPLTRSKETVEQEGETSNAELLAAEQHKESADSSEEDEEEDKEEEDEEEEDEEEDKEWSGSEL